MRSRFGNVVTVPDAFSVDAEGYVTAVRVEGLDGSGPPREYHLNDLRTDGPGDEAWMREACARVSELRREASTERTRGET